jgi:Carboxypeptidase regulatory-like domain/TonB-dependent Receptor Plug Domain
MTIPRLGLGSGWRIVNALVATVIVASAPARAQSPLADSTKRDSVPATLVGHVVDTTGIGVAGAEITLNKSDKVHAITGDSGEFRIAGIPPGTAVFNVRRIGFESASFTAVLKPGKVQRAKFALTPTAQELPTVAVSDTANKTHWLDDFTRRQGVNRGTFITRAEIERRGARSGTDIVRQVPGIRLVQRRGGIGYQVVMTRGDGPRTCIPQMFVHNMAYSGTLDDFSAEDIEAIEVYTGTSEVPAELDKVGRGVCGAIVVWTRDPRKPPQ